MTYLYPTGQGRESLAAKLNLPLPDTQDWEWIVADASRFDEFVALYLSGNLDEAERFSLMEILVQCTDDIAFGKPPEAASSLREWQTVAALLEKNCNLHADTIEYWSCGEEPNLSLCFWVTAPMRALKANP